MDEMSRVAVQRWVEQLSSDDRKMLDVLEAEYPPLRERLGELLIEGVAPQSVPDLAKSILQIDLMNDFEDPGRSLREWIEEGEDWSLAHYKRMAEIAGLDLNQLLNEV